jgi:ribosomal protein S7
MDDGRISKATKSLLAVCVADDSKSTFETIKSKFPDAVLLKAIDNLPPALQVKSDEIESAIYSFPVELGPYLLAAEVKKKVLKLFH